MTLYLVSMAGFPDGYIAARDRAMLPWRTAFGWAALGGAVLAVVLAWRPGPAAGRLVTAGWALFLGAIGALTLLSAYLGTYLDTGTGG